MVIEIMLSSKITFHVKQSVLWVVQRAVHL